MLKAVLDTNQFVSALISRTGPSARLLAAWRDRRFILIISPEIIGEIRKVLDYSHIKEKYNLSSAGVESALYLLEHEAVVVPDIPQISVIKEDPDDDKILACALAAEAGYIVSGDKHLLELGRYEGIRIVPAGEFLRLIK